VAVNEGGEREWRGSELFGLVEYLEYGAVIEASRG
jgi:hypothetical protein